MAERINLVQGDTRPAIIISLNDDETGSPISITESTTRLYIRAVGEETVLLTLTAQLLPGKVEPNGSINTDPPYEALGSGGRMQFNWQAGDLDIDAGAYEGEIEITFADGSIQTVYDVLKFNVREDF
jgi:hypothetical protein